MKSVLCVYRPPKGDKTVFTDNTPAKLLIIQRQKVVIWHNKLL